jgi:hypothetical protein
MPTQNQNDAQLLNKSNLLLIPEREAVAIKPQFSVATKTRHLWRGWKNVNETDATILREYLLRSASAENKERSTALIEGPWCDGEQLPGRWVSSTVFYDSDSRILGQLLIRLVAITTAGAAISELQAAAYQRKSGKSARKAWAFTSMSGTVETLTYEWTNLDPAARTILAALADDDLVTAFGSGYTHMERELVDQEDGTLTLRLVFVKPTWSNKTPSFQRTAATAIGGLGYETRREATGIPSTSGDSLRDTYMGISVTTEWARFTVYTAGQLRKTPAAWGTGVQVLECVANHTSTNLTTGDYPAQESLETDWIAGYWRMIAACRYEDMGDAERGLDRVDIVWNESNQLTMIGDGTRRRTYHNVSPWIHDYRMAAARAATTYGVSGYLTQEVTSSADQYGFHTIQAMATTSTETAFIGYANKTGVKQYTLTPVRNGNTAETVYKLGRIKYNVLYKGTKNAALSEIENGLKGSTVTHIQGVGIWEAIVVTEDVEHATEFRPCNEAPQVCKLEYRSSSPAGVYIVHRVVPAGEHTDTLLGA